jgi:hypothetical protein
MLVVPNDRTSANPVAPEEDRPVGRSARRVAGGNGPGKRAPLAFSPSVGLAEFGA